MRHWSSRRFASMRKITPVPSAFSLPPKDCLPSSSNRPSFSPHAPYSPPAKPPTPSRNLKKSKTRPHPLQRSLAVTLAECRLQQADAADAERIMEGFIAENSRLPGLADAFEALDRIYAQGGAASSAELRRWAADSRNAQRAALALFYLARNEARASKSEKSRQLFSDFLAQYPDHFLANEARAELSASQIAVNQPQAALQTAKAGAGFRNSFVRGQAEAALGEFKQAADSFLQAAGAPELEMTALENAAVCALLSGASESENPAMRRLVTRPDFQPVVDRIRFLEAMRQASSRSGDLGRSSREDRGEQFVIRATRKAGACRISRYSAELA